MTQVPTTRQPSIEQIVEGYRPAVLAFFRRRLPNSLDAEDAVQEVLARLARRAGHGDAIADVERNVFHAEANHLRELHRRARVRPKLENEEATGTYADWADEITPERHVLGREAYEQVLAALRELPERPRTIFILNRYEEMSGRQIARHLGLSQRAVEKHISRVLAHLRDRLA